MREGCSETFACQEQAAFAYSLHRQELIQMLKHQFVVVALAFAVLTFSSEADVLAAALPAIDLPAVPHLSEITPVRHGGGHFGGGHFRGGHFGGGFRHLAALVVAISALPTAVPLSI